MDYAKANMEVCKALSHGEIVRGHDTDNDCFFVTTNGFYGFIIPKEKIVFDIRKVKKLYKKVFSTEEYCKPDSEIRMTNNFYLAHRDYCRRFDGKSWKVFVRQNYLKMLGNEEYKFFQKYDEDIKRMPVKAVLATTPKYELEKREDEFKRPVVKDYQPVMLFMPINIIDYEE